MTFAASIAQAGRSSSFDVFMLHYGRILIDVAAIIALPRTCKPYGGKSTRGVARHAGRELIVKRCVQRQEIEGAYMSIAPRWLAPAFSAALMASCPGAAAGATPAFGIYAYSAQTWNNDVAKNFPIVFVQYHAWARNGAEVQHIRDLASAGSRVIIDFEFLKTRDQRVGREAMPPLADTVADANYLFEALKGVPIEAVTLDEENLTSAERLKRLGDLYSALKKAYPDRRFLQWISATTDVAGLKRLDLRTVPADGWVMDPYRLAATDYPAYVREMRSVSKRLYSIVWAAPSWQIGGGFRKKASPTWWNDRQWKVLYSRLAVNQANGIPSIFYLFTLNAERPLGVWRGNACDRSFYTQLSSSLLPHVRQHSLSLQVPATKPHWMPTYC